MFSITVVIPAHDDENTVTSALESVVGAAAYLAHQPGHAGDRVEAIVIDDGSRDGTLAAVLDFAKGKDLFRIFHRRWPSSPGSARNCGALLARGELLFFLDADDVYLENHLFECCRLFEDPAIEWVKTGIALSDTVHDGWPERIYHSLVINVATRRRCHEFVGGFPDVHLCRRSADCFEPWIDVFRLIEDVHYNNLLRKFFRLKQSDVETVRYMRRPGNSFDRQYEKFQHPPGAVNDPHEAEFDFRVKISKIIIDYQCETLQRKRSESATPGKPL